MGKKYIDADALLNKMQERYSALARDYNGDSETYAMGFSDAIEFLENAPTADVEEVRHGEWIYEGHHEMMGHVFRCSICERWMFTNSPKHVVEDYPYCHCGAKMESVKGFPRD